MAFTIGTTTSSGNAFIGGSAQRKVQLLCDGSLLVVYHDGTNWQAKQVTSPTTNPAVSSVTGWPTKTLTAAVPDVLVINNGAVTSDIWVVETQTNVGVTHGLYTPGSGVTWDTTTQIAASSTSAFWPQIAWTGTNLVVACQDKPGGTNYITTVFWTATKNGTAGWSAQISGFESNVATSTRYNRPLLVHDATVACCLLVYSDAASSPYPIRTRILSDAFTPALANWGPQVDLGISVDLDAAGGGVGVASNQYDDMNGLQAIIDPKTKRFHLLVTDGRSASVLDPYYLNGTIAVDTVTVANNKVTLSNTVTVDTDNHNTMVAIGIDGSGQVWILWGNEPGSTTGDIMYTTSGAPYSSVATKTNLTNNLSNNNQGTHIPQNVVLSGPIPIVYAIGSGSPWTVLLDTTVLALGSAGGNALPGNIRFPGHRGPQPKFRHRPNVLAPGMLRGPQPQGLLTAQGNFGLTISTPQSITGLGFQPRVIYFAYNYQTATGYNASGTDTGFGFGVACLDGSQWFVSSQVKDNVATGTNVVHCDPTGCIGLTNDAAAVVTFARLLSMDVDGFTLSTTTSTVLPKVSYLALGGTDLQNAHAGYFMGPSVIGSQSITGLGFQPNLLLLDQPSFALSTNPPFHSSTGAHTAFGAGSGTNPLNRWALDTRHGDPTTADGGVHSSTKIIAGVNNSASTADIADLTSLDVDGFTLNWTAKLSATSCAVFYLATKTVKTPTVGSILISSLSTVSATFATYDTDAYGLDVYGTGGGDTPVALLAFSDDNNLADLSVLANGRFSFGMASSGASTLGGSSGVTEHNYWWGSRDNAATTIERSQIALAQLATIQAEATGGTATSATTAGMTTNYLDQKGFTLNSLNGFTPINSFSLFYIAFSSSILDRVPSGAESHVATDAVVKGWAGLISDTLTAATDAILKAVGKPITDTLTAATDAVVRRFVGGRTVTDPLTAAVDSVAKGVGKGIADALTAALDSVQKGVGKTVLDTLTAATDAVSRFFVGSRSVSDPLTAAIDSVKKGVGKIVLDTLTAAIDAVSTGGISRAISDTLSAATDSVQKGVGKLLSDTLTAAVDSLLKAVTKTPAEVLTAATDSIQKGVGKLILESLSAAADAIARGYVGARSISEALTAASDAVVKGVGKFPAEVLSISDSLRKDVAKIVRDTMAAALDSLGNNAFIRAISDSVLATDALLKSVGKPISDVLTAATDSLRKGLTKAITDTLTAAADVASRVRTAPRSVSDGNVAVDSLLKAVGKPVLDTLSAATDAIALRAIGRVIRDTLSAANDTTQKAVTKIVRDAMGEATDLVLRSKNGSLNLLRTATDSLTAATDVVSRNQVRLILFAATVSPSGATGKLISVSRSVFTGSLSFVGSNSASFLHVLGAQPIQTYNRAVSALSQARTFVMSTFARPFTLLTGRRPLVITTQFRQFTLLSGLNLSTLDTNPDTIELGTSEQIPYTVDCTILLNGETIAAGPAPTAVVSLVNTGNVVTGVIQAGPTIVNVSPGTNNGLQTTLRGSALQKNQLYYISTTFTSSGGKLLTIRTKIQMVL